MNKSKRLIFAILVLMLSIAGCQVAVSTASSSIPGEQIELMSIAVSRLPYKLEYSNKEVINTAGGQLELKFSNDQISTIDMSDDMVDFDLLNMSALGQQNVTIRYTLNNRTRQTSYSIAISDINIALEQIAFVNRRLEIDLYVGSSFYLSVFFLPDNASNKAVEYQSTNEAVLSVDQTGLIRALMAGSAQVRVTSLANGQVITKSFVVTELLNPLSVTYARQLIANLDSFLTRLDPAEYTLENYQKIIDVYKQGMFDIYQTLTETDADLAYAMALDRMVQVDPIPAPIEEIDEINYAEITFDSFTFDITVLSGGILNPSHPVLNGGILFRNITVSAAVADGTLIIEDLAIFGELLVLGGGANSVILVRVDILRVIVSKNPSTGNQIVRVEFADGTFVEQIIIENNVRIETSVNIPEIIIEDKDGTTLTNVTLTSTGTAKVDNLKILAPVSLDLSQLKTDLISVQSTVTLTGVGNTVVANQGGTLSLNGTPSVPQGIIEINASGVLGSVQTGFYNFTTKISYATFDLMLVALDDNQHILVTEGTYVVGNAIVDKDNVTLIAAGRRNVTILEINELGVSGSGFTIRGFTLDGLGGTSSGNRTIATRNSDGTKIINNKFTNAGRHIQLGDYYGPSLNVLIKDNEFNDGPNAIAGTENSTNVEIVGNKFNDANRIGIGSSIVGLDIKDNDFDNNNTTEGVRVITDYRVQNSVDQNSMTLQQILEQNKFKNDSFIEPYGANFQILNNNLLVSASRIKQKNNGTVVSDVNLTTTKGEGVFNLQYEVEPYTFNSEERLSVMGDAKEDLIAQVPGAGAYWGVGYLGYIFEKPTDLAVDNYRIKVIYSYAPNTSSFGSKTAIIENNTQENYIFAAANQTEPAPFTVAGTGSESSKPVNSSGIWIISPSWANFVYYITIEWINGSTLVSTEKATLRLILDTTTYTP